MSESDRIRTEGEDTMAGGDLDGATGGDPIKKEVIYVNGMARLAQLEKCGPNGG